MPTPSLILVPARFKTGKLYTPVATTTGALVLGASGDFNVTRATTATRVNASGLIESVASGIPRLDYFGSSCPALLVEPAATNLIFPSNLSGSWGFGSTVSATTSVAAPDGSNTLAFNSNSSGNTEFTISRNNDALASGAVATFSCFAKIKDANVPVLQIVLGTSLQWSPNAIFANFNLASGTISAGTYTSARIENYGNGWYRCSVTATSAVGTGTNRSFVLQLQTSPTAAREAKATITTGTGMYLWGAQLETGSVATSYIPTTTAAVTRNADVISVSGAVSGCVGQTEGTVYLEMQADAAGTGQNFLYVGGNAADSIVIGKSGANCFFELKVSGTTLISQNVGLSGTVIKGAIAYANGNYAAYANGNFLASGTTSRTPANALSVIAFSSFVNLPTISAPTTVMRVRAVALYTTRLTNAQLAALTTP